MGTRNNPGAFNCYAAALPDEEIFTVLARDPAMPATIRFWIGERARLGKVESREDQERIAQAVVIAEDAETWREKNLDPTGDGVPSWKLPRQIVDDEPPIRMMPEVERDSNYNVGQVVAKIVVGLRQMATEMVEGRSAGEGASFFAGMPEFSDRINGYAKELADLGIVDERVICIPTVQVIDTDQPVRPRSEAMHLQWIYDRMVSQHDENPLYDYMHRFKEIIERLRDQEIDHIDHRFGVFPRCSDFPIPPNVYYSRAADNFYDVARKGKGVEFYAFWAPRRNEFPVDMSVENSGEATQDIQDEGDLYANIRNFRGTPPNEDSVLARLAGAVERLNDGRLPAPHDLYRAVAVFDKQPNDPPWSYECIGIGLSDLEVILTRLTQVPDQIDSAPEDLSHKPEMPGHRFSSFFKGQHYAYARGLEISPTHLPGALDAMRKDGWHLLAIFGQTDSEHVGFIFQRQPEVRFDLLYPEGEEAPGEKAIINLIRRNREQIKSVLTDGRHDRGYSSHSDEFGDSACGLGRQQEP